MVKRLAFLLLMMMASFNAETVTLVRDDPFADDTTLKWSDVMLATEQMGEIF